MKNIIITFLFIASFSIAKSQLITPAIPQVKPILVKGGIYHLGNGSKIENGYLLFENGKIKEIGKLSDCKIAENGIEIIKSDGKHIYPGFISTNNTLGLTEIDAVRATQDFGETGSINPHVRALIAFNTDSRVATTVRTNGVLLTQATPQGGLISGQSSVMQLDAWNWEDAQIKADDGIHLNWPRSHSWNWKEHKLEKNKNLDKQIEILKQLFTDAQGYKIHRETNLKLEAMQGLYTGEKKLYIHTTKAKDILSSVAFATQFNVKNIVVVGGAEAHLIPDFLLKNNISVILQRVQSLPRSEDEPVLNPYEIATKLNEFGVKYCISYAGDMEAMNSRNLPFSAGITISYGVEYEKAVESISLSAAQILGIDKKYGSLEMGKSATLIISDGDALDVRTNNIIYAFIDGRAIDLNNHQKELFKKFSEKYSGE